MNEKESADLNQSQTDSQKDQILADENFAVPFTARLMAYYRAQECKHKQPLIVDPFADRLAGDMTAYIAKHGHFAQVDYSIVRSYYIEQNLLAPWCYSHAQSQIVLLGAGLDTRAYRFKPLKSNSHTIFELDFPILNHYKTQILKDEQPLCELVRISGDLSKPDWASRLLKSSFSQEIPTFWVLEGVVYYLEKENVVSLLKKIAAISAANSQIFVDICVPALAELDFGPFTRHFKWGIEKQAAPTFFGTTGWNVLCSFADDHNQGRDVGQRGQIFVHGVILENYGENAGDCSTVSDDELAIRMTEPELQAFAAALIEKIVPEVEEIVEIYQKNPKEGFSRYIGFIKNMKPSLERLARSQKDPASLGLISPRLLRDPLSIDLKALKDSPEATEAHVVGYLKAILQLAYCGAKGLEGWEFPGTPLHEASLKSQNIGKIHTILALVEIVREESTEGGD